MVYINCGCGNRFCRDPRWINIDFHSMDDDIKSINILKGLPFPDGTVDAVFSCCMLEHFTKEQAKSHLKECYRILREGGICRIIVPDLEDVCREYLRILQLVKSDEAYQKKYEYILIELIDQMTRMYSGGEMQKYWDSQEKDEGYILERTGYPEPVKRKVPFRTRLKHGMGCVMEKMLGWSEQYKKYRLGSFMMSGETHKWMYDEYGLSRLMTTTGFSSVRRKTANDSAIPDWDMYSLEMDDGKEYKPHSLYIEGVK